MLSWILFIVVAHWNNSPRVSMLLSSDTLFWYRLNQYLFYIYIYILRQSINGDDYLSGAAQREQTKNL
jgi:hypothetical protein